MNDLYSGGAFYSAPAEQGPLDQPRVQDKGEFERANVLPMKATPPAYDRNARFTDTGVDTFAPGGNATPAEFQPEVAPVPEMPMPIIPLLAAGLFALWMIFEGKK